MSKIRIPQPGVLVLADLQFGGDFGIELTEAERSARAILTEATRFKEKIHLLVLPGDLTSKGKDEEFDALREFLDAMLNTNNGGLDPHGVVFCPGNHDLLVSTGTDRKKRFAAYVRFAQKFYSDYWERFGGLRLMRAPWLNVKEPSIERPPHADAGVDPNDIWTVYDFSHSIHTYVVSLNTAADIHREGHDGKGEWHKVSAFGYIDPEKQLDPVRRYLKTQKAKLTGLAGIAVLHHNVAHARPVRQQDVSAPGQMIMVRNYVQILETLQRLRFDLVVHGHQHEALVTTQKLHDGPVPGIRGKRRADDPAITVFGAGSTGCSQKDLRKGTTNTFHFIQFEAADPVQGRLISYDTFSAKDSLGDDAIRWEREYSHKIALPVSRSRHRHHIFSLIEQSNIATAPSEEQALERLVAFFKNRVGYSIVGANFVRAVTYMDSKVKTLASTFGEEDRRFLNDLYDWVDSPKVFEHRSVTVEIGKQARPSTLERVRDKLIDSTRYLKFLQSQLRLYGTLSTATYWFREAGQSWIGLRVYTERELRDEPFQTSLDALEFRKLVIAVLVYWRLHRDGAFYAGAIRQDVENLIIGKSSQLNSDGAVGDLWDEPIAELFNGSITRYWAPGRFTALEPAVYAARRDIERLIIYSMIHQEIESEQSGRLFVDDVASRLVPRLRQLSRTLLWRKQVLGTCIDPLLVTFWVPLIRRGKEAPDDWKAADLHYLLTRDQIVYCAPDRDDEIRARTMADLRNMLSMRMRGYGDLVFDGISAYVRASEAAYTSRDAYRDPLVRWHEEKDELRDQLPAEAAHLVAQFRRRSKDRDKLTDYEQRFWRINSADPVGVFVAPIWGRDSVEAIIQVQTTDLSVIDALNSVDFYGALDGIKLEIRSRGRA
ncbi:MAG TPA: metallophosphoesterase [Allosphingosinicella sp.]|nr:metallophosphoesterase [Allosphingosinicella sp.]